MNKEFWLLFALYLVGLMAGFALGGFHTSDVRDQLEACRAETDAHMRKHLNPQARDLFEGLSGEYE